MHMNLALKIVYRLIYVITLIAICAYLQGCAAYSLASGASLVTTGKSVGDHVLSNTIPHADCTALNLVKDKYYCEVRDISKTYNRTGI
jgi:hypothetical protein